MKAKILERSIGIKNTKVMIRKDISWKFTEEGKCPCAI